MGRSLTGKQRSTIVLKAMQYYDFKRRRMMDGCMKPFLTRLRSEMKISIDERTVRRLLETMKEQEDSGAEVFDFDSDDAEAWLIKEITKVFKIKVLGLPALIVGITINWTKISKAKKIAYLKDSMQRCIYLIRVR